MRTAAAWTRRLSVVSAVAATCVMVGAVAVFPPEAMASGSWVYDQWGWGCCEQIYEAYHDGGVAPLTADQSDSYWYNDIDNTYPRLGGCASAYQPNPGAVHYPPGRVCIYGAAVTNYYPGTVWLVPRTQSAANPGGAVGYLFGWEAW